MSVIWFLALHRKGPLFGLDSAAGLLKNGAAYKKVLCIIAWAVLRLVVTGTAATGAKRRLPRIFIAAPPT